MNGPRSGSRFGRKMAGIGPWCRRGPTVQRWLRSAALVQPIRELRTDLTSQAAGLLAEPMSDAARTLRQLCLQSESEHIRLKAAEALLAPGKGPDQESSRD
jgi:hypothetical protein